MAVFSPALYGKFEKKGHPPIGFRHKVGGLEVPAGF